MSNRVDAQRITEPYNGRGCHACQKTAEDFRGKFLWQFYIGEIGSQKRVPGLYCCRACCAGAGVWGSDLVGAAGRVPDQVRNLPDTAVLGR